MGRIPDYSWILIWKTVLKGNREYRRKLAETREGSVKQPFWPHRMLGQGEN